LNSTSGATLRLTERTLASDVDAARIDQSVLTAFVPWGRINAVLKDYLMRRRKKKNRVSPLARQGSRWFDGVYRQVV
jgi:hypothetical protein